MEFDRLFPTQHYNGSEMINPFAQLFRSLVRQVEQGRRVAFCTVVGSYGSTPQAAGASMLLHENMTSEGTLGGGCVEAEVRKRAFEILQRGESTLLSFQLDHDYGWDDGLICGGTMKVAVTTVDGTDKVRPYLDAAALLENGQNACLPITVINNRTPEHYNLHIEPPAKLVIAGAGHVGAELAKMAVNLDFETTVIDDRADMMGPNRLPTPIRAEVGNIEFTLRQTPIDANTFVEIGRAHV